MTIEDSLKHARRTLVEAQKTIELLTALPSNLNLKLAFWSQGRWRLQLEAMEPDAALALFPPESLTFTGVGTTRSAYEVSRAVSPSEVFTLSDGTELMAPVHTNSEGALQWYSSLHNPVGDVFLLYVELLDAPSTWGLPGYTRTPKPHHGSVFLRTVRAPTVNFEVSPMERFNAEWEQELERFDFNAKQTHFVNALKTLSKRCTVVSLDWLPSKTTGVYADDSYLSGWQRIGNVWDSFSEETLHQLFAISNRLAMLGGEGQNLEDAETKHCQQTLIEAKGILHQFFNEHIKAVRNGPRAEVLEYYLKKTLALDIVVSYRESRRAGVDDIAHDFWLWYRKFTEGVTLVVPAVYSEKGFDWDTPEFIEYEPMEVLAVA